MKAILLGIFMLVTSARILLDNQYAGDYGQISTLAFLFGLALVYLGLEDYFVINDSILIRSVKTCYVILFLSYVIYSAWVNNMPLLFTRGGMFRIHGFSIWMLCGAIISAFAGTLTKPFANKKLQVLTKYNGEACLIFLILSIYSGIYMAVNNA